MALLLEALGVKNVLLGPVDLALSSGEVVGLSGPSGSGKTLLLRALADLDPFEGELRLDGIPSTDYRPEAWRRAVGLLPAESAWWAELVGNHFTDPDQAALRQLGFGPEVMEWSISRLSTGERQRLSLLRLLQNEPRVLLLDEPTASLDPVSVERAEQLVRAYVREREAAVLWVSHDPDQLARIPDRRLTIDQGRLAEVVQ